MNTLPAILGALCVYAIAYRYYSAFVAAKVLALDDRRTTPAHTFEDGHNYVPSPKLVPFGHHFAAIAGAGLLVGPTLAAQFGFAPGFRWILIGAVLAGCVHDFMVLVACVRHGGRWLAEIARTEMGRFAGLVAMLAVLFILLVTLAGLGIVVVNALANSPWGVFTIGMTIPIGIFMGLYMFKSTPGQIKVAVPSAIGVLLLIAAVVGGRFIAMTPFAAHLTFSPHQITLLMAIYGFVASVLPVWFLLEPRDYLSTYVKLGTIAILVPPDAFAKLGMHSVNLNMFSAEVGENLAGRTGGAVSLAVGMAQIFRGLPGMARLMGYWYHYAIMFEALFILTTIDTGTRVARYVLQELLGKVHTPFANAKWVPGNLVTTTLVVFGWGYLIYTGSISTLWPLFGTGNQLLATIALAVSTTFLINMGKAKYAWITAVPMLFVGVTTLTAGVLSIQNIFWPLTKVPGKMFTGYLDSILMSMFVVGVILVLIDASRRCWMTLHGAPIPKQAFGPPVVDGQIRMGCC